MFLSIHQINQTYALAHIPLQPNPQPVRSDPVRSGASAPYANQPTRAAARALCGCFPVAVRAAAAGAVGGAVSSEPRGALAPSGTIHIIARTISRTISPTMSR